MGIYSNTCSIAQFQVRGERIQGDDRALFDFAHELLARVGFRSIDEGIEEESLGFVHLDDQKRSDFESPASCWRDSYVIFSMRRDTRKVPSALLKEHLEKECAAYREEYNIERIGKMVMNELKEKVKNRLLAKTLPDPKVYDVVWNTETGIVTFTTLSNKTIEIFQDLFKRTFDGLRLVAFHPYERAMSVLNDGERRLLGLANKATSEDFLSLIKGNQWLGRDFLLWLTYQTLNSDSEYRVNQVGPEQTSSPFTAYIDDKLMLCREAEGGTQFTAVSGPQDRFEEVKSALTDRKEIIEASIHLECADEKFALTLKGEMFHFASFSCPPVKLEKDQTVDESMEREAVFFERMALLQKGEQLFNSLFATFLRKRLGGWAEIEADIWGWLEAA